MIPAYGDRAGLIQWLADFATLPVEAQQDERNRKRASLAMKRFILTRPTEQQFTDATKRLVLTPEILYTLTIYEPSGKK